MPGPFEAAGTIKDPTRFAALTMGGEQFTGEWTQRSPYRDAATAYLLKKFYGGSRFDSILDGINREITVRLTDGRRPGSVVYNAQTFPPALSFFSFKSIQNGIESVRVLLDGTDGNIWDATAGTNANIFTKGAGAGPMRFMNVNTELFMGDGVNQKKWLNYAGWQASKNVLPGTLINVGAEPGSVQMALGGISLVIIATASNGTTVTIWVNSQTAPNQFPNLVGATVAFSGLTGATYLNGHSYPVASIVSTTLGIFTITLAHAVYSETSDTGTGSTGNGTTGGSAPSFSGTQFAVTADGSQQWKCYGPALENWGLQATSVHGSPVLIPINGTRFWQSNTVQGPFYSILDPNQNIQVMMNFIPGGVNYKTGLNYPNWTVANGPYSLTFDGTAVWWNFGPSGVWTAATAFGNAAIPGQILAILDSNQNLQVVTNGGGGNSGGSNPTWATAMGATTTDGALTWTCVGPGVKLTTASISYAFSTHAIDGSVSTASLPVMIQGGILGAPNPTGALQYIQIAGGFQGDTQIDQLWIWRTPQGQSTLILEDQIPTDTLGASLLYYELGIPDTSTNGGGALNAFIAAPVASANNPPPAGITGMVYHLQRTWGFVDNLVYYSGGPDTLVGNGNTAWPPLNFIAYIGKVIKLRPITVQNGGILVYTTSGIWIILGTGTSSNPFYTTIYADKIILGGYNVEDVLGTEINLMESNGRVSSLTVTYPFNPQSGYNEVGLPIGDQFLKVTTGGISAALYTPATSYLSWNIANTRDVGMYVADGAVGWFRMGAVSPPESGLVWSPRAAIAGGTSAVQSVEVSPGVFRLLIGPPAGPPVPILMRDTTGTHWDDNGTAYPAWDSKGVTLLCSTGQVAEIGWIATKSAAVGARPTVSVLMGEVAVTANTPWTVLQATEPDPANQPPSQTVYSDRYTGQQGAAVMKSDSVLTKFDYGSQAVADELLDFAIYGAKEEERKQQ
jgi:hypothetical protein